MPFGISTSSSGACAKRDPFYRTRKFVSYFLSETLSSVCLLQANVDRLIGNAADVRKLGWGLQGAGKYCRV